MRIRTLWPHAYAAAILINMYFESHIITVIMSGNLHLFFIRCCDVAGARARLALHVYQESEHGERLVNVQYNGNNIKFMYLLTLDCVAAKCTHCRCCCCCFSCQTTYFPIARAYCTHMSAVFVCVYGQRCVCQSAQYRHNIHYLCAYKRTACGMRVVLIFCPLG